MSSEASELIDKTLEQRSSLLMLLSHVRSNGDGSEALKVEYQIAELDGLLALLTAAHTKH
jgi:hypothetical protein